MVKLQAIELAVQLEQGIRQKMLEGKFCRSPLAQVDLSPLAQAEVSIFVPKLMNLKLWG
jgi:hypothetical protein